MEAQRDLVDVVHTLKQVVCEGVKLTVREDRCQYG